MKALIVNRKTYEVFRNSIKGTLTTDRNAFYYNNMVVCDEVEDLKEELEELIVTKGMNPSINTLETAKIMKLRKKNELV